MLTTGNPARCKNGGATSERPRPSFPATPSVLHLARLRTFEYFKEATGLRGKASNEPAHRSDGVASEDDNVLVQGIEGDKNALGYFGFAYYEEAGRKLTAAEIDGGNGCVAPSFEAALKGEYIPLSRPLLIYTTTTLLDERDDVLGFVKFYVDNMNALAEEVGYISLPEDLLTAQKEKIEPFLP